MSFTKKKVSINFFITGQEDRSKAINTPDQFKKIWINKFATDKSPFFETRQVSNEKRDIVLSIIDFDVQANFYFGYVGKLRNTTLPTKFNKQNLLEENISLGQEDEIMEKSYFIYYASLDILVFHYNHLGPRADDLAYMLYRSTGLTSVHFSSIWKDAEVKSLLEDGAVIKSGAISLAIPRQFDESSLDLSNNWSSSVLKMMSDTGMSSMTIKFRSRASTKKSGVSYMVDEFKGGMKELLDRFGGNRKAHKSEPSIRKAEIWTTDGKSRQSLLDQDLKNTQEVRVQAGYPTVPDMRQSLIHAKIACNDTLKQYYFDKR
ncbi:TPA: hypothetical protein P0E07_001197 [Vibrio fluvialis]|nr:hypothetical protein [Vibrio fluvialis]